MRKLYIIAPHDCFIGNKSDIFSQTQSYIIAPPKCFKGYSKSLIDNKVNIDIKNKCKIVCTENKPISIDHLI